MDATSKIEPLQVPGGLALPDELVSAVPRELPASINDGRVATARWNSFWRCSVAGVICAAMELIPFIRTLALYILPLGYLTWIGGVISAIGVGTYLHAGNLKKVQRYIREGHCAFAQVLGLVKNPTAIVNGQTTTMAFIAQLQMLHPDTGEAILMEVKSSDFSADYDEETTTRFRVGDWIPVIWLPGDFENTLQVYDFLEATPNASLVRRAKQISLWQTLVLIVGIVFMFVTLFWNIYAYSKYRPLDGSFRAESIPFAIGGVVGLVLTILGYRNGQRKRRQRDDRNVDAINSGQAIELEAAKGNLLGRVFMGSVLVLGAILLCGLTVVCWSYTANAWFDESPATKIPVQITNMTQTTHSFLFREYNLEYQFDQKDEERTLLTTPQHLDKFILPQGAAHVREGRFGWAWVETIDPIVEMPADAN